MFLKIKKSVKIVQGVSNVLRNIYKFQKRIQTTYKKKKEIFHEGFLQSMGPNPQEIVNLVTFTGEILNKKFHFFVQWEPSWISEMEPFAKIVNGWYYSICYYFRKKLPCHFLVSNISENGLTCNFIPSEKLNNWKLN